MNLNELSRAASLAEQLTDVNDALVHMPDEDDIVAVCEAEPFCLQLVFRSPDGSDGVGVPIPAHLRYTYAKNLRAFLEERREAIASQLRDLGVTAQ